MVFRDMKKRGQAALEFLTTYGWAILVVLVMIAALSTFGVLNPDALLPERCNVGPEFACDEYQAIRDDTENEGQVSIILTNQIGETLQNVTDEDPGDINITIGDEDIFTDGSEFCTVEDDTFPLPAGADLQIDCEGLDLSLWSPVGSKQNFDITFEYEPQGSTFNSTAAVELYATVQ